MILRDRTAIRRIDLSKPIRMALQDGIVSSVTEVFDYGCGLGDDVRRLTDAGITTFGWDPAHQPGGLKRAADVVNLGYVVNVVERADERAESLRDAWGYAKSVLVIAARLKAENDATFAAYEDGCITRLQTFQKFYEQHELREWIADTLGETPIAAAPGVFYVFRDASSREAFIASRHPRDRRGPGVRGRRAWRYAAVPAIWRCRCWWRRWRWARVHLAPHLRCGREHTLPRRDGGWDATVRAVHVRRRCRHGCRASHRRDLFEGGLGWHIAGPQVVLRIWQRFEGLAGRIMVHCRQSIHQHRQPRG